MEDHINQASSSDELRIGEQPHDVLANYRMAAGEMFATRTAANAEPSLAQVSTANDQSDTRTVPPAGPFGPAGDESRPWYAEREPSGDEPRDEDWANVEEMIGTRYVSLVGWSKVILALLAGQLSLDVVQIVEYFTHGPLGRMKTEYDYAFYIYLLTGLLLGAWAYRAHENLRAFNTVGAKSSPMWVFLSYFVPLHWAGRGNVTMQEIWKASDPLFKFSPLNGQEWKGSPPSLLITVWWISHIFLQLPARSYYTAWPLVPSGALWTGCASLISTSLAVAVVRAVSLRQDAKIRTLRSPSFVSL